MDSLYSLYTHDQGKPPFEVVYIICVKVYV